MTGPTRPDAGPEPLNGLGKQYLGDGVYVAVEGGMVKLTTEDGRSVTNEIYLEPEVLESLLQYIKELHEPAD